MKTSISFHDVSRVCVGEYSRVTSTTFTRTIRIVFDDGSSVELDTFGPRPIKVELDTDE